MRYLSTTRSVDVLSLIRSIFRGAQTGTLHLDTDEGAKNLYFVEGQLHLCKSVNPLVERIDTHLKDAGRISVEHHDAVLAELLQRTAKYLASWKVDAYRFMEGFRVDADELVGPLPTALIVGETKEEDWQLGSFLDMIGGLKATLVATDASTSQLKSSNLNRTEMDILIRLVRPATLAETLPDEGASSSESLKALSRLWELGLVKAAQVPSTQKASSASSVDSAAMQLESNEVDAESARAKVPRPFDDPSTHGEHSSESTSDQYLPVISESSRDSAPAAVVPKDHDEASWDREWFGNQESGAGEWYHHFGLLREPFSLTPDPAFLFLSDTHIEALSGLKLSLLERRGLCVMTGEVGTGKTTLLYSLLSSQGAELETAYIHNPALPFDQLLESLLDDLGVKVRSHRRIDMLKSLNQFVLECAERRRTLALIIDEAQNLADPTFEALRLMLNFETYESKLLQIVLVGQPELGERLRSDRLRQIADRIAIRCHVGHLSQREACDYVRHRLEAAGGELDVFSGRALRFVAKKTGGIPRRINAICHNAMLFTFGQGKRIVSRRSVIESSKEFEV